MDTYDIVVIGSGGGSKIAIPAAGLGYKVAFVEKDSFGGTCLNRGCIPSKMLIYPAELLALMRDAHALNLTNTHQPRCDFESLVKRCSETVDTVSRKNAERAAGHPNITLFREAARFTGPRVMAVGNRQITAAKIVIATGSIPAPLAVEGVDRVPFMTSREALRRTTLPRRLIVIGAGYIAAELGFAYAAFGAQVHFIVRSRFLRNEDDDVCDAFNAVFPQRYHTHYGQPVKVQHADGQHCVTCRAADGTVYDVEGDALLVAVGVVPDVTGLDLEKTGVELNEEGFIRVDPQLRTSADGIYAMGDCIGRYFFRHTVNAEGEYLMQSVFSSTANDQPMTYGPVPHAVFTHPQVASVGPTERELSDAGRSYVCGRAAYADSAPGMARVTDNSFVKVIVDSVSRRIIAAHIIGEAASDMIHLFVSAMVCRATLDMMLGMIFVHPALPEVARDALRDARDKLKERACSTS